jgi:hypothetical protein
MAGARKRAKARVRPKKPTKKKTTRRAAPRISIQQSVVAAARVIEPAAEAFSRVATEPPPSAVREPSSRRVAEAELLHLAREVHGIHHASDRSIAHLRAALARLANAFADGPLPRAMFHAWLHRDGDERAALALAWAREQLRLALEELLQDEIDRGRARSDVSAPTLAWLLLAACEAMAHEPAGSVDERVDTLVTLTESPRPVP